MGKGNYGRDGVGGLGRPAREGKGGRNSVGTERVKERKDGGEKGRKLGKVWMGRWEE